MRTCPSLGAPHQSRGLLCGGPHNGALLGAARDTCICPFHDEKKSWMILRVYGEFYWVSDVPLCVRRIALCDSANYYIHKVHFFRLLFVKNDHARRIQNCERIMLKTCRECEFKRLLFEWKIERGVRFYNDPLMDMKKVLFQNEKNPYVFLLEYAR